jgi:hypothetical protein
MRRARRRSVAPFERLSQFVLGVRVGDDPAAAPQLVILAAQLERPDGDFELESRDRTAPV